MEYSVGDTIVYSTFAGHLRVVLVEEKEDDIKNGSPGFGGTIVEGDDLGMGVWGYDNQIVEVRN